MAGTWSEKVNLFPVKDEDEADTEIRVHKIKSAKDPRAEFFNQLGNILKG